MRTENFKDDILEVAGNEKIEAIVIGKMDNYHSGYARTEKADAAAGNVLTWDDAALLLDYEYDSGYGGVDCNAITAWTKTRVLFVAQYDGATWVSYVYRNPTAHDNVPMPGG